MDKVNQYREAIKKILNTYKELMNHQPHPEIESVFVFDEQNDNYAWLKFGWTKNGRLATTAVFVRLREGKFYIEEDWTEEGIANELLAAAVPREDIVLAFQPPSMRQYTEFAAA